MSKEAVFAMSAFFSVHVLSTQRCFIWVKLLCPSGSSAIRLCFGRLCSYPLFGRCSVFCLVTCWCHFSITDSRGLCRLGRCTTYKADISFSCTTTTVIRTQRSLSIFMPGFRLHTAITTTWNNSTQVIKWLKTIPWVLRRLRANCSSSSSSLSSFSLWTEI